MTYPHILFTRTVACEVELGETRHTGEIWKMTREFISRQLNNFEQRHITYAVGHIRV